MSPRARLLAGTVLALLLGALGVGLLLLRGRGPAPPATASQDEARLPTRPGASTVEHAPRHLDAAARRGAAADASAAPRGVASASRPAVTGATASARQAELLDTIRRARPAEALPPTTASRDGGAALGAEEIRGAIRALQPKLHECYAKRLKEQEGLSGTLVAKFTIVARDGKGTIDEGEIKRSTLGDLRLETCMLHALTTARFPMPRGEGRVVVNYPFRFQSK